MRLPVFMSLQGYRPGWLRDDAVAGLTVWAVLVPEALAYASIAGVSPVVGLYAAPGALIFYAAFGSSKHLVTGLLRLGFVANFISEPVLSPASLLARLDRRLDLLVGCARDRPPRAALYVHCLDLAMHRQLLGRSGLTRRPQPRRLRVADETMWTSTMSHPWKD